MVSGADEMAMRDDSALQPAPAEADTIPLGKRFRLPRVATPVRPPVPLPAALSDEVATCTEELLAGSGPRLRATVDARLRVVAELLGASRVVALRVDRRRRQLVVDFEWAAAGTPQLTDVRPYSEFDELPWSIESFDGGAARLDLAGPLAAWLGAPAAYMVPASIDGRLQQLTALSWSTGAPRWLESGGDAQLEPALRQLGLVMATARERRELTERASYDELTGLANRQFLVLALGKMLARVSRGKTPGVAVLFCQLVGLDPTDRSAIERADAAVARAAVMLERSTRETDFVGRWDDTTFAALCDEVPASAEALRIGVRLQHTVLQEIRQAFSDDPTWARGALADVRVAVGVAFTDGPANAGVLLRQGDGALLEARRDPDDPVKLIAG